MSINPIIDGVVKTVITPQVNIDGVWKTVNIESNNINGTWRESYNSNVYKIYLYRYGVLYKTLSVTKGSKVTLPSVSNVYDDDVEHYGWTKIAGATTRSYTTTGSFTPTSDMTLHAVYKAVTKVEGTSTMTSSNGTVVEATVAYNGTITITGGRLKHDYGHPDNAPSGYIVDTTTYSKITTGTSTTADSYIKINNSFKAISLGSASGYTSTTLNVSKGDTLTIKGYYFNNGGTSGVTSTTTIYISITYPAMVDNYFYRSSYGDATITMYDADGNVWQTKTVAQGYKYTIPEEFPRNEKNNVFRGWGSAAGSSSITYSMGSSYTISSNLKLYPVYYDYSYNDTDGDGYFVITGGTHVSVSGFSTTSGPISNSGYSTYTATLTFTNGTTKQVSLGNTNGDTTVQFNSSVGVVSVSKPENTTENWDNSDQGYSSSDYGYASGTTSTSHYILIRRYIN